MRSDSGRRGRHLSLSWDRARRRYLRARSSAPSRVTVVDQGHRSSDYKGYLPSLTPQLTAQAVAVAGPSHWDHTQPAEDPTCSTPPALPLLQKDRHDEIERDTKDDEGNVRNDVFCLDSSCELLMQSDEEDDDNGWGRELARDNVSLCASLIALKGDSRPSVRAEDMAEEVAVESSLQKVEEPPVAPVVEPGLQPTERVLRHSSGPMSRHWSANTESEPEPEASMS
ncbi:hypothetical protein FOCC_FOCC006599, partial [Frankliniella occidentalis]